MKRSITFKLITATAILICMSVCCYSQISGNITDNNTQTPVEAASVFLSTTSIGTVSNASGNYSMNNPSPGNYILVVSCIGYETFTQNIEVTPQPQLINIKLKRKIDDLETVTVSSYDANGWEKWGRIFTDQFIGKSANAGSCKIVNRDVLRFRKSSHNNTMSVTATDRIIIENTALGYRIHYKLESFQYDFDHTNAAYTGFPFFEQLIPAKESQQKKWEKKRQECYYGSILHFMRSLFQQRTEKDGFILSLTEDPAKRSSISPSAVVQREGSNIVLLPGSGNESHNYAVKSDEVIISRDSSKCYLWFKNFLQINYTKKQAPYSYLKSIGTPNAVSSQLSYLFINDAKPVTVMSNGYYYDPRQLVLYGYWMWSENISNLLPYDYSPAPNQ